MRLIRRVGKTRPVDRTIQILLPPLLRQLRHTDEPLSLIRNRRNGVALLDKLGPFSDSPQQIDAVANQITVESLMFAGFSGATRRIRTDDLLITNQLLYQLS
jgi:hypothetical protein